MSQLRLVVSQNLNRNSRLSKLNSVTCKMLPAHSSELPLATKVRQLHALRPAATELLEKLVDDLIAEVS